MTVATYYSETGNGGGRTHTDSMIADQNVNAIWTTVRDAPGDSVEASRADMQASISALATANLYRHFFRVVMSFDTSEIGGSSTISSATLSVTPGANPKTDDFTDSISLVGSTPDDPGTLVGGDYAQLSGTKFASDITVAAMNTDGTTPNVYSMTSPGLAGINQSGITSLGLICLTDFANAEPTHPGAVKETYVSFHSADEAEAGDERPVLTVTYTAPPFTPRAIMF